MKPNESSLRGRLSTKVLLPVLAIMVLLLAITAWTVNQRLTRQFQLEGARSLATADAVFQNSQELRIRNLLLRYRNLPKEPRYRAALLSGDRPTLSDQIKDLPRDQGVDVAMFTSSQAELVASANHDPRLPIAEFEASSAAANKQALRGTAQADTIRVGEQLFDVVAIPVFGPGGDTIGALTFGSEIGDAVAQEFSLLTRSKIVLLADGKVIASTVPEMESQVQFARYYNEYTSPSASPRESSPIRTLLLGDEHYFCSAGHFTSLGGGNHLGYLLLSSYEQPLRALRSAQQMLLLVSLFGLVLGSVIVWFMVRRATQPLRELRDGAEAVGRGDFSRRVEVASRDECGELAEVFNRMTGNLESSRAQLEQTVETLRTTQAHLIQSEKLSGIGEFVAGVAHELNNPLTAVMGFSELLAQGGADPQQKRHLEMIYKSALRCQKIVQSLLSFARRHQPERKLSNLNALIETAVEFLQYQLRTSNIEVSAQLDPKLPLTMVDPHQVQQVFLNIINNARQAIEGHRPRGHIRITTETRGPSLRVVFKDDGPGIAPENLSKLFDPFFTTKEVGKGTGLGLSLCYGIIKEHGGSIVVRSQPGDGASFEIDLPLVAGDAALAPKAPALPLPAPAPGGNLDGAGRKVLVIDDEEAILQMMRDVLLEHGYEVDVVRDGESALRQMNQTCYDLALCDWKMPGLNGEQVYERLRVTNPALSERMIFITGDVINHHAQKFLEERHKLCLSKPFSLAEFRTAIVAAFASAARSGGPSSSAN